MEYDRDKEDHIIWNNKSIEFYKKMTEKIYNTFPDGIEQKDKEMEPIKIWKFEDAPEEFRNMSISGDDKDWLALISPTYINEYLPFLEGDSFGCCSVDEFYIHKGLFKGYKILIGAHA